MDIAEKSMGHTVAICNTCPAPVGCFDAAGSGFIWECTRCEYSTFCEKRYFFLERPFKRVSLVCENCTLSLQIRVR